MEEKVRNLIEKSVNEVGVNIDNIEYVKEGNNYFLRITIDRDMLPVDIDTCVEVTKIINPLLDNSDFIDEIDALEVWSKEKGE